jgi:hypothetical protein
MTSPSESTAPNELARIASPAPRPQSLAFDGTNLWVGSWETGIVYGIDAERGRVFEEVAAPGKPVGSTVMGDELRFVVSENGDADNRVIRRFVPGSGFASSIAIPCPEDTGSFLAFDGTRLWLSQRYDKRVLVLDEDYESERAVPIGEEILGIAWAGTRLYLSLWLGRERGGNRLAYVDAAFAHPEVVYVGQLPFVGVSLAFAGDRLWTNDFKRDEIVALALPD